MTEKAYGFGKSAIDEFNKQPGTQRLPARQFALLMAGLAFGEHRSGIGH